MKGREKISNQLFISEDTEQVVCCGKGTEKIDEKKELRRRTFPLSYSVQNYVDVIGKL